MGNQQPSIHASHSENATYANSPRVRVEWLWKSNADPYSASEPEEWRSYSAVETAIIEEAYKKKQSQALLDDYHISFRHLVQISNNDEKKQRPVKRVAEERTDERLREERFMPNPILPSAPFASYNIGQEFLDSAQSYLGLTSIPPSQRHKLYEPSTYQMIVEKAAEGLIGEGKSVGKQKEGEWMARQLLNVKNGTREEMYACCARLYCMESFLYKKLNEIMRLIGDKQQKALWQSKVATLGPFALLFYQLTKWSVEKMTVYRGANLPDDLIIQYRCYVGHQENSAFVFPAYTSTSRNRAKAEQFGNVLFIIDIDGFDGYDVSPYSDFDEEEHLIRPDFRFYIQSCVFDKATNKWVIHLQSMFFK